MIKLFFSQQLITFQKNTIIDDQIGFKEARESDEILKMKLFPVLKLC